MPGWNQRQLARLNHEHLAAIEAYARENGRAWKRKLTWDWQQSAANHGTLLHQVRNLIGPSVLYDGFDTHGKEKERYAAYRARRDFRAAEDATPATPHGAAGV